PQRIFEIGDCLLIDERKETKTKEVRKLACAISDTKVGYEDISTVLDSLLSTLGISYKLKRIEHESFIQGRVAGVFVKDKQVGFIGEIHPLVLEKWNLEMPVVAFEIEVEVFK
ncbi:MAG: phenylalanine--tRNA ligase subunit beta, partial [Candidatus Aenigmarchaeota archaeon]|nr:phenylalanine--tRNA ligase subunit beta [Candidatus Aenigmarchaeota archaeon]